MAQGTKRAAPDNASASASGSRSSPPTSRRRLTNSDQHDNNDAHTSNALAGPSSLRQAEQQGNLAVAALSERLAAAEQDGKHDLTLSLQEARDLRDTLAQTVSTFYETPASKGDILALLHAIDNLGPGSAAQVLQASAQPHQLVLEAEREQPSPFQSLPYDILRLILIHLRDLYLDDIPADSLLDRTGVQAWYRLLKGLRHCSSSLREVCASLVATEVVITRLESLKREAKWYAEEPAVAQLVTRWTLQPMHYHLHGSDRDIGFVIPDMIRSMSNLTYLNIGTERRSGSLFESVIRGGRSFDFDSLTGGVSVPDTIVSSLPNLRELVYGVPTTFDSVVKFATAIPSLRQLSVVDEVERLDEPVEFRVAPSNLRRLWLPTTVLNPVELGQLLGIDVVASDDHSPHDTAPSRVWEDEPRPKLDSLAFCFDAEQVFVEPPPNEQEIAQQYSRLEYLFSQIGGNLVELHLATVGADDPDMVGRLRWLQAAGIHNVRARRAPGRAPGAAGARGGGIGPGPNVTFAFAFGGPNPPGPPAANPPAANPPARNAPAPAAPAGAAPANPPAAAQNQAQQQQHHAVLPALGAGLRNLLGLGGGNGGANAGLNANATANAGQPAPPNANAAPPAPAPPPQNANAGQQAPPVRPIRTARRTGAAGPPPPAPPLLLPPPPVGGGAAGLQAGINLMLGGGQALPPSIAFFAEMLEPCKKLERLELYGRRYDAALVDLLLNRPLRRLSLSVPNDDVREAFVDKLLAAVKGGSWPSLNRLELSASGGDWPPAERRKIMQAASARPKLLYRSTDH
ncbi:hypothetical protein JCM10908_001987 [Rhodotorula pacifica]|uniref:uncharacterized protein n=1 Tax=Rhodotorula pacifica TaxID=1495444 RepID=UPI00317D8F23